MKRPFSQHQSLFFIIPLLIVLLIVFALLSQAKPTAAEQPGSGVCVRFSLDQGRNAASGAGVNGRYEMREVTTGALLASWEADSQETISDWLTDLPQVSDDGSWVEVNFYPAGEETAVSLQILNPAPNTPYGWVANGQCHAIELQFTANWDFSNQNGTNQSNSVGGGMQDTAEETVEIHTESGNEFVMLQEDWVPNLDTLVPLANTRISESPSFLQAGNLGAWVDEGLVGYGFTLVNRSLDHVVTNVQYEIKALDENGNLLGSQEIQLRDLYPGEVAKIGDVLRLLNADDPIESIEIVFANTAEQIALSTEPQSLVLLPPSSSDASLSVSTDELGESDLNNFHIDITLLNPNGAFIAQNIVYHITAYDSENNILINIQGDGGDIYPRQRLKIFGDTFLQSPDQLARVEVEITPENFVLIDPTMLPQNIVSGERSTLVDQHVTFSWYTQRAGSLPLQEFIEIGTADAVVIAYDADGAVIGGGSQTLFNRLDLGAIEIANIPVQADQLPSSISLFVDVDYIDDLPPRGGQSHIGRDNFPTSWFGVSTADQ